MTNDAQFALRRIIEKNTKNTRFCMICNYVNKIIPALQSRCTRFRFGPLQPEQVRGRLEHIISEEVRYAPCPVRPTLYPVRVMPRTPDALPRTLYAPPLLYRSAPVSLALASSPDSRLLANTLLHSDALALSHPPHPWCM